MSRHVRADRKSLLLGTALVTTLLLGSLLVPSTGLAQVADCADPGPDRVAYGGTAPITCLNTEFRDGDQPAVGDAIYLTTDTNPGSYIYVNNSGFLAGPLDGIDVRTETAGSYIDIINYGTIFVGDDGIAARVTAIDSPILIDNSGEITAGGRGIFANAEGIGSPVSIYNRGATIDADDDGIYVRIIGSNNAVLIDNSGAITSNLQRGIYAYVDGTNNPVGITNSATINAYEEGILALAYGALNPILIINTGAITSLDSEGIDALTVGANSPIDIINSGAIISDNSGLEATTIGPNSPILIENDGSITSGDEGINILSLDDSSPVAVFNRGDITAVDDGISVETLGVESPILIENSGAIDSGYVGIDTYSRGYASGIVIRNSGAITSYRDGIEGDTYGSNSSILIENSGSINTAANGLNADTGYFGGDDSDIIIRNSGAIIAGEDGIEASTYGANSSILIENDAAIRAGFNGIIARSFFDDSDIAIRNSGSINADKYGIEAESFGFQSDIAISNSGAINADKYGIRAYTYGLDSDIGIANLGDITAVQTGIRAETRYGDIAILNNGTIEAPRGISALSYADDGVIEIVSNGTIVAAADNYATGIIVRATGNDSIVAILNTGNIDATAGNGPYAGAFGIRAVLGGGAADSTIVIVNNGDITANVGSTSPTSFNVAIYASSYTVNSPINITSTGKLAASGPYSYGILARTDNTDSDIAIVNAGDIESNVGIAGWTFGPDSSVSVTNAGSVRGERSGIWALSYDGDVTIVNSGDISASSYQAIEIHRGDATILNSGLITGYVFTYDGDDTFINQPGGVFETKRTSFFGPGTNLFRNEAGGTVLAATNPNADEISGLASLDRFENRGLISMVDGREGDTFFITGHLGQDIDFVASGRSTLAIDAFLGGPGSQADIFQINGNVQGKTALVVNNTNSGAGAAGAVIPVVEIAGNVKPDAFYLPHPIDTGFFEYDLFFREINSGVFELRSFVGAGSFVLPQLLTGTQDIWHATSSTWFDRTADLRVLLAGGGSPIAYDPTAGYANGAPSAFTPAVWARGGGNWLDRQGSETVNAFGNNYRFKLDRDLEILDFQMGLDLGKRDFLSQGDILVFGVLGGFVNADLDYDQLVRQFDFEGGQIGGYATYLKGGLFVDTLLNVHLLDLETATLGFPSSLDATTVGLRTDTGYRFGSFNGGAFIEPLATLAVLWSDIDGFTSGANRVSFDDEANVRGRLGLRVGTSYPAWTGTTVEPFVIGSLWGNLSGDNQATLVSNGTRFRFEDDLDDVWGEVSAGVNFFNPTAGTAVFAKVDVTFGDDVDGIGGKAGMRVAW